MAGVITDLIDRVSDSSTGRPVIATLAAPGKAIAAASINIDAATNWTTSSAIHFSIYETTTIGSVTVKDASTQTDWKGTLSGTAISNLTITGGTDRAYTAGAKVEITPTARYAKDLYDWAMVGHNQNGTHKAFTESNIVPTAALQDNAVTTVKINNGAVTMPKIANPYKFRVSRNAAASTGNGAFALISFDTEQYDTNNNFASGVYTVPVTGYYQFNWMITATMSGGADEAVIASLYVAGVEYTRGTYSESRNTMGSGGSDLVYCTVGQVIDIRAFGPTARSLFGTTATNFFSGYLVSTT